MYPAKLIISLVTVAIVTMLLPGSPCAAQTSATPTPGQKTALWFDQLVDVPALDPADEEQLVQWLGAALVSQAAGQSPTTKKLPKPLRKDTVPRMIFASVSDGQHPATVIRGSGLGVAAACDQVLARASQLESKIHWLKIDLVRDVVHEPGINPAVALNLPRSLFGLAFEQPREIAFLAEELVAYTLVNSDQLLSLGNIRQRPGTESLLVNIDPKSRDTRWNLYRFSAASYFVDGETVLPLIRGHRSFDRLTPELLLDAARQGGDYLRQAVDSEGRFVYSYRPKTDHIRNSYNILRHSGTIYSMMELYEVTRDKDLLAAAERAIGYLRSAIRPCTLGNVSASCAVEDNEVKLGGNGLAMVALAKYSEATGTSPYADLITDLGRWIVATQNDRGEFEVHKQPFPEGPPDRFRSEYYPGEALLALLRGSQTLGSQTHGSQTQGSQPQDGGANPGWLDVAAIGARWLIEVRDHGVRTERLNHDHWLLYALNDLHRRQPDPLYLEHADRITQAILERQNRKPAYRDWLGSYYRPPRSTPTATRSEGLTAAYQLERDFGDPKRADAILEAIELGIRFQLQTQFQPESVLYLPDPQRALGGFHRSLENFEIRIDYVQHNISSLLALRQILLDRVQDR